jgi:secondary thiamine-phosphate synthase enzyme
VVTIQASELTLSTEGRGQVLDVSGHVRRIVEEAGLREGLVTVFVPGSTGAVTTIEYEPGAVEDFRAAVERLLPEGIPYRHNQLQGDDNGHSHVRAAFLGPSLSVPLHDGRLQLGTWQQIVFVDFDTHPRRRRLLVQMLGA